MKTRQKILLKALEMFNEHGVHGVGVRDIARALEISPGNLQYHFPQKDRLVTELVMQLHEANNQRIASVAPAEVSFHLVYRLTRDSLRGHIPYRGIMMSYAEVVASSEVLTRFVAGTDDVRAKRMRTILRPLVANGHVDPKRIEPRWPILQAQLDALGRFWLPAAVLDGQAESLETAADQRAQLMLQLWEPYATEQGRQQIAAIVEDR